MTKNQCNLVHNALERGLNHIPVFSLLQKGQGRGTPNEYGIDELEFIQAEQDIENKESKGSNIGKYTQLINDSVSYKTSRIKTPPRYLLWASKLFKVNWQRKLLWSIAFLLGYICPIILILFLFYVLNFSYLTSLVWVIIWGATVSRWANNVTQLVTNNITCIYTIDTPSSSICIARPLEATNTKYPKNENFKELTFIEVFADCPICKHYAGQTRTIVLHDHVFIGSRITGICKNNPKLHRYTFDKDAMIGMPVVKH